MKGTGLVAKLMVLPLPVFRNDVDSARTHTGKGNLRLVVAVKITYANVADQHH